MEKFIGVNASGEFSWIVSCAWTALRLLARGCLATLSHYTEQTICAFIHSWTRIALSARTHTLLRNFSAPHTATSWTHTLIKSNAKPVFLRRFRAINNFLWFENVTIWIRSSLLSNGWRICEFRYQFMRMQIQMAHSSIIGGGLDSLLQRIHSKLNRLTPRFIHSFAVRTVVSDAISNVCTICAENGCLWCPDATIYTRVNFQSRSQWTGSWNVNMNVVASLSTDKNMRAINFLLAWIQHWNKHTPSISAGKCFRFKRPIDVRTEYTHRWCCCSYSYRRRRRHRRCWNHKLKEYIYKNDSKIE